MPTENLYKLYSLFIQCIAIRKDNGVGRSRGYLTRRRPNRYRGKKRIPTDRKVKQLAGWLTSLPVLQLCQHPLGYGSVLAGVQAELRPTIPSGGTSFASVRHFTGNAICSDGLARLPPRISETATKERL